MTKSIYCALVLCIVSLGRSQLAPVELTKDDIIDIYKVPIKEQPAYKFEWRVEKPTTFRIMIETKKAGDASWTLVQEGSRSVDKSVYLVIIWNGSLPSRKPDEILAVPLRWGFENRDGMHGWGSFDFAIPASGRPIGFDVHATDPDNLFTVVTTSGLHRIRIVKDPKPKK